MCLISIAPRGVNKYTEHFKNIIENGMYTNSNGTGFAVHKNNSAIVSWKKGYNVKTSDNIKDEFNRLWDDLKSLNLENNDILVVHSRIATVGKVTAYNTHPFLLAPYQNLPLSGICAIEGKTKEGVLFHNGGFTGYRDDANDYSDTCHLTHDLFTDNSHLFNYLIHKPYRFKDSFKSVLLSNKVAVLNPDKGLILFGNFTEDPKGYKHSNMGYDPKKYYNRSSNYTDRSGKTYDLYGEHDYDSYNEDGLSLGNYYDQRYNDLPSPSRSIIPVYNYNRESVEPEVMTKKKFTPIIEEVQEEEDKSKELPKEYSRIYTESINISGYYKGLTYLVKVHPLYLNYFLAFPIVNEFYGHDKYTELSLSASLTTDDVMLKNGTSVTKGKIDEVIKSCIVIPKPEHKRDFFGLIKLINASKATSNYLEHITGKLANLAKNQEEVKIKKPVKDIFTKVALEHYVDFYKMNGYLDDFLKRKRDVKKEMEQLESTPDWSGTIN